jgi:hypothetical protein
MVASQLNGVTALQSAVPTVFGPDDFSAVEGSQVEIEWTASDDNPVVYFILENGSQVVGETWFGDNINYTGYAPMVGAFVNYTVIVWDADAQYAIDTVLVTGLADTFPPEFTLEPEDITYNEGTTGHTLYWEYIEHNIAVIDLYLDGIIIYSDLMNANPTSLLWGVDGLNIGEYNYTLYIDDIWSRRATSTVFVTVVDASAPIIDHPVDLFLLAGESTNNATWIATDTEPSNYTVYLNGTVLDSGTWISGEPIVVDLSGVEFGIYNITIVVADELGNTASDTLYAFIIPTSIPAPWFQMLLLAIGGIAVVLVILVVLLKMKR